MLLQVGFGLTPLAAGLLSFAGAAGALLNKVAIHPIVRWFGFRSVLIGTASFNGLFLCAYALFRPYDPARDHHRDSADRGVLSLVAIYQPEHVGLRGRSTPTAWPRNQPRQHRAAGQLELGVGFAALLLHGSLMLRGGMDLAARDVSPAFLVVGLVSLASLPWFFRLPRLAGAEVSGGKRGDS